MTAKKLIFFVSDECRKTKEKLHNNNGEWDIKCLNETVYISALQQRENVAQKLSFAKFRLKIKRKAAFS